MTTSSARTTWPAGHADAVNSPGSAMKPFTYLTTFMKLGWGPGSLILDTPICVQDGDKQFCPANPSHDYHGAISVRNALGNSLNVPAFKAILAAGVNDVVNTAKKMGITEPRRSHLRPVLHHRRHRRASSSTWSSATASSPTTASCAASRRSRTCLKATARSTPSRSSRSKTPTATSSTTLKTSDKTSSLFRRNTPISSTTSSATRRPSASPSAAAA